jgi:uncharacterized membrane protein YgaE (UPF0421/DUF939 family)
MTIALMQRKSGSIGATLRDIAQLVPGRAALADLRARVAEQSIPRLTATAVFGYLLAVLLPGTSRPVLAPLTALLVVQATRYQTMRSAVHRVASVVAGVVVALAFTAAVGFTWWSLGLVIAVGLLIGSVLRLGHHMLEVPISAMLIMSLGGGSAATGRVVDTVAGAVAGLISGLIFSRVKTQPAEHSIGKLSQQMAGLLEEISSGLTAGAGASDTETWLARARSLTSEIQQVDDTLGEAEDSLRLTPRALRSDRTAVPLRNGLEALEHAAANIRGLTRSLTDDARLPEGHAAVLAGDTPDMLAGVLSRLAAAIRDYGGLIRADGAEAGAARGADDNDFDRHLDEVREERDRFALRLDRASGPASAGWRLHGEMLVHLDRLTSELQVERLASAREEESTPPAALQALRNIRPRRPVICSADALEPAA